MVSLLIERNANLRHTPRPAGGIDSVLHCDCCGFTENRFAPEHLDTLYIPLRRYRDSKARRAPNIEPLESLQILWLNPRDQVESELGEGAAALSRVHGQPVVRVDKSLRCKSMYLAHRD